MLTTVIAPHTPDVLLLGETPCRRQASRREASRREDRTGSPQSPPRLRGTVYTQVS